MLLQVLESSVVANELATAGKTPSALNKPRFQSSLGSYNRV